MGRECVFCGGSPVTKEHGWPRWIDNVLAPRIINTTVIPDDFIPKPRGSRKTVSGSVVRGVCRSCNSGWMGSLEAASMPLLEPLILGRGTLLDAKGQATVATWSVKTCLVHLLLHSAGEPKMWTRFTKVYKDFYESQSPLTGHHVSVAGYTGEKWPTIFHFQPLALTNKAGEPFPGSENANISTIVIGHFVVQVLYMPAPVSFRVVGKARFIHPFESDFIWPYGLLSPSELEWLAKADFLSCIDFHPRASSSKWTDQP